MTLNENAPSSQSKEEISSETVSEAFTLRSALNSTLCAYPYKTKDQSGEMDLNLMIWSLSYLRICLKDHMTYQYSSKIYFQYRSEAFTNSRVACSRSILPNIHDSVHPPRHRATLVVFRRRLLDQAQRARQMRPFVQRRRMPGYFTRLLSVSEKFSILERSFRKWRRWRSRVPQIQPRDLFVSAAWQQRLYTVCENLESIQALDWWDRRRRVCATGYSQRLRAAVDCHGWLPRGHVSMVRSFVRLFTPVPYRLCLWSKEGLANADLVFGAAFRLCASCRMNRAGVTHRRKFQVLDRKRHQVSEVEGAMAASPPLYSGYAPGRGFGGKFLQEAARHSDRQAGKQLRRRSVVCHSQPDAAVGTMRRCEVLERNCHTHGHRQCAQARSQPK